MSLSALANEPGTLVQGLVEERAATVEIAADLPAVIGDRLRLRAVFQNLLGNAVKYMGDQSSPCVEVGMRRGTSEDPAETVVFVSDNGIGIDPKYHDKIFGLFERLDATDQGTGLGLALVKRIVETHGGRIWVESEGLGHGSTFCFILGCGGGAEPAESGSGEPAREPLAVT